MTDIDEKQEAEFMKALHTGFQQLDDAPPGEIGLARLKRDIQREQQLQQKHQDKSKRNVWKPLAIAACCVVGVQMFLLIPKDQSNPGIVTLSGGSVTNGPTLQIVFNNEATAAQIQQALTEVQGNIISGPGALGIYTVVLPKSVVKAQILAQLQNLEFVEEVIDQHDAFQPSASQQGAEQQGAEQ